MLISLLIENFRSFGDEQELSAVANGKHQNLTEHLVEIPTHNEKLVPVLALWGPNGAGKSSVVDALGWVCWLFRFPTEKLNREAHAFFGHERPTKIVLRFLSLSGVYELGLEVGDTGIESEWLSTVSAGGSERAVYQRRADESGKTRVELGNALESPSEKLRALALIAARPHELFLSRIHRDTEGEDLPQPLAAAIGWFLRLVVLAPDTPYSRLGTHLREDDRFRALVSELLVSMGTGVESISSDAKGAMPSTDLAPTEREAFEFADRGDSFALRGRDHLVKVDDANFEIHQMLTEHRDSRGNIVRLAFESESDGTKRLAHLAPGLFIAGHAPIVLVVDELDRSLHAILVKAFVREFIARAAGSQTQLIFTTHETHALDQELLRRDEVWFVEKNKDGASELYSLDDFPVRTDLKLDRSYLQGRFGAVPNLRSP